MLTTPLIPQVFEYLTGAALFQLYETDTISIEDVHLRRITELTGQEFPKTFLEKCGRRDSFFDSKTGKRTPRVDMRF